MIISFPLHRRRDDIQRCATALETIHGEEANIFWRTEMRRLAAGLQAQGVGPDEIAGQIAAFNDAVQSEIRSRWLDARQLSEA